MTGASLSDSHLGFRAFSSITNGRNTREQDVERAWHEAIDVIINGSPQSWDPVRLVTIAGDVFHHPRPSGHAIKAFRDGLRRLSDAGIITVAIQGNHDAGRSAEVLSPIIIPDDLPGVLVAREPIRYPIDMGGFMVSVSCFPYVDLAVEESWKVEPDPDAEVNILVVHAAVKADNVGLPFFYGGLGALDMSLHAHNWDVIAVGDYHDFTRLHPDRLAFYSGSLERTSSNIWPEADKGLVFWRVPTKVDGDTFSPELSFRSIHGRPVHDIPLHEKQVKTVMDLNEWMAVTLTAADDARLDPWLGSILRFTHNGLPRSEKGDLDWALVRKLKAHCLHFQLDITWKTDSRTMVDQTPGGNARTLLDEAQDFLAGDKAEVRECALFYLTEGTEP